jgi:glycine cleavage system aminomethyltransferase T
MFHTISHMREAIQEKNFRAKVTDVTHELGVLSLQGQWSAALINR